MELDPSLEHSSNEVTIIIPTYNDANYLYFCLDSIRKQTKLPSEVIVIDDGSINDDAKKVCNLFDDVISVQYHKVKNCGPSAARNFGAKIASNELIMFLDADDLLLEDSIESLFDGLQNYPKDCVGICGKMIALNSLFNDIGSGKITKVEDLSLIGRNNGIAGQVSTFLFKKDALDVHNLFSEDLRHFEDFELILRISKNKTVYFLDKVVLLKRKRKDSLSLSNSENAYYGALSFLKECERNLLLNEREILKRKKEANLTYGKSLFYKLKFSLALYYLIQAFKFDKPNRIKEILVFSCLKLFGKL